MHSTFLFVKWVHPDDSFISEGGLSRGSDSPCVVPRMRSCLVLSREALCNLTGPKNASKQVGVGVVGGRCLKLTESCLLHRLDGRRTI